MYPRSKTEPNRQPRASGDAVLFLFRRAVFVLATIVLASQSAPAAEVAQNLSVTQSSAAGVGHITEKRIALVIGNAAYKDMPLANPVNDASDIAERLRAIGFEVVYRENLPIAKVGSTLTEFRSKLVPGAVAVVFYAGHGLQIKGENYFPSVSADISSEEDVPFQSLSLRQILELLDEAKTRVNLVFLDACRNNPYDRRFRSASRGLAKANAPSGTLIAYSTRPGSVASDGDGRNGLYTQQLLAEMKSTQPIEQVLKRVLTSVKKLSRGKQEPWSEGSLEGDFCFGGCTDATAEKDALIAEVTDWAAIKDSKNPDDFQKFNSKYPKGSFAALAAAIQAKLIGDKEAASQQQDQIRRLADEKAALEKKRLEEVEAVRIAKEALEKAETEKLAILRKEEESRKASEERRLREEARRVVEENNEIQSARLRAEQAAREKEQLAETQKVEEVRKAEELLARLQAELRRIESAQIEQERMERQAELERTTRQEQARLAALKRAEDVRIAEETARKETAMRIAGVRAELERQEQLEKQQRQERDKKKIASVPEKDTRKSSQFILPTF